MFPVWCNEKIPNLIVPFSILNLKMFIKSRMLIKLKIYFSSKDKNRDFKIPNQKASFKN